jgi:S1-C subfamily serine protease
LLVVLVFWQVRPWLFGLHDQDAVPRAVTPLGDLAEDEKSTIELFRRASPSVVFITSKTTQRSPFSLRATEVPQGSGSGFFWDANGYIVTNFHVIQRAQPPTLRWRTIRRGRPGSGSSPTRLGGPED